MSLLNNSKFNSQLFIQNKKKNNYLNSARYVYQTLDDFNKRKNSLLKELENH